MDASALNEKRGFSERKIPVERTQCSDLPSDLFDGDEQNEENETGSEICDEK